MYTINILRTHVNYTSKYHAFHKSLHASFSGFSQTADNVILYYSVPLTEQQQSAIQLADVGFVDNDPFDYIKSNILIPARTFGNQLIDDFAAENILLGITQANMTNSVRKTLSEVTACLMTGSLYDAMLEARAIPNDKKDATFITNARLLAFINKIEIYLNLPLSTQL